MFSHRRWSTSIDKPLRSACILNKESQGMMLPFMSLRWKSIYTQESSFRCFCTSQVSCTCHTVQESNTNCLKETLSIQLVPDVPEYSGDMPHLHCKINNSYPHRWSEILKPLVSMNQQLKNEFLSYSLKHTLMQVSVSRAI